MQIQCPSCSQAYEISPEQEPQYAGQTIQCTRCGKPFVVTLPTAADPIAPPPMPPPTMMPQPGAPGVSPMQYQAPGAFYPAPPASALAVVSLVLAILGLIIPLLGLVAIICGIVALSKTRDRRVGGRGLAIAGISVGGAGLVVSMCTISILLPSLNRARETANRVKCASNLRQIAQAMLLYANDNRGAYPPTPDLLLLTQDITPREFVCPSSDETPASQADVDAAKANSGKTILTQGHDSYVYLGNGFNTNCAVEVILLYEPLSNHNNDGGNFMYGDGHVEFQGQAAAQALISELNAGHNPPRNSLQRRGGR
jgi:predicted Zn finger-like uncharacterized protein/prepilin-type processing-associated H-X9-DG protein